MIVEITKASIDKEQVVLEGTNLETVFVSEDLFEDIPEETVRFVFDRHEHRGSAIKYLYKVCQGQARCKNANRHEHRGSAIKYLYKVCQGQARCKNAKSMGEKIEALVGCIISLSESFIEKA